VGVLLDHGVLLHFVSFLAVQTCWTTFQAKNNVRHTPANSFLTLVSHQSHKGAYHKSSPTREERKEWSTRRTRVSFSRASNGAAAVGEKANLMTK